MPCPWSRICFVVMPGCGRIAGDAFPKGEKGCRRVLCDVSYVLRLEFRNLLPPQKGHRVISHSSEVNFEEKLFRANRKGQEKPDPVARFRTRLKLADKINGYSNLIRRGGTHAVPVTQNYLVQLIGRAKLSCRRVGQK